MTGPANRAGQTAPADPAAASGTSDADLLAAHVAGDPEAFGELFRRHRDRLWAVAVRTTRDREDAADALQEAMLSAVRHAAGYRGDAAVTTWLHRIVVNACLDRLRRRSAHPAEPLPEDDHALAEAEHYRPDETERRQTRLDVLAALDQLNPDQRAALVLVDMQGYSVEDAARMLDCATGTVKSRCARGRARLAPLLAHLSGGNHASLPGVGSLSDPAARTRPSGGDT
jgi:RNA polymerase sigma-70 factor (ECF subfamily)